MTAVDVVTSFCYQCAAPLFELLPEKGHWLKMFSCDIRICKKCFLVLVKKEELKRCRR